MDHSTAHEKDEPNAIIEVLKMYMSSKLTLARLEQRYLRFARHILCWLLRRKAFFFLFQAFFSAFAEHVTPNQYSTLRVFIGYL